jgi:hypothetical protein
MWGAGLIPLIAHSGVPRNIDPAQPLRYLSKAPFRASQLKPAIAGESEDSASRESRCIAYHLARGLLRGAENGCDALVDVGVGGGPIADADTHGGLVLPDCAAAPAGSVFLNGGDGALCLFGSAEGDEDLIEDDFVEDLMAGGAQGIGEAAALAAIALDHFGQSLTAEGTDRGINRHCAGAA